MFAWTTGSPVFCPFSNASLTRNVTSRAAPVKVKMAADLTTLLVTTHTGYSNGTDLQTLPAKILIMLFLGEKSFS